MTVTLPSITESAVKVGLAAGPGGAHGNRTMMLAELTALFDSSRPNSPNHELRRLVLEENVLNKSTASNRREVISRLGVMYGLRRSIPIYCVLRYLWNQSEPDRPLLALLVALARDSFLRATASVVIGACAGETVTAGQFQLAIEQAFPEQHSAIGRASVSRHAASSWAQSGHLVGRTGKVRKTVAPGPAAVAMALWLGYACGQRGPSLYDTFWMQTLDLKPSGVDSFAVDAHRRGWIDYRRLGDVLEIRVELLSHAAMETVHGEP